MSREWVTELATYWPVTEPLGVLARAHLALLDECENLRLDKERLDVLETYFTDSPNLFLSLLVQEDDGSCTCRYVTVRGYLDDILASREPDAAISENAANASGTRTCASCGKTNPNWRYNRCPDCGELASSEVDREQDSSVSGAGQ